MLKNKNIMKAVKANVLEKPTRPVKHACTEEILDYLVASNGEKKKNSQYQYFWQHVFNFA